MNFDMSTQGVGIAQFRKILAALNAKDPKGTFTVEAVENGETVASQTLTPAAMAAASRGHSTATDMAASILDYP